METFTDLEIRYLRDMFNLGDDVQEIDSMYFDMVGGRSFVHLFSNQRHFICIVTNTGMYPPVFSCKKDIINVPILFGFECPQEENTTAEATTISTTATSEEKTKENIITTTSLTVTISSESENPISTESGFTEETSRPASTPSPKEISSTILSLTNKSKTGKKILIAVVSAIILTLLLGAVGFGVWLYVKDKREADKEKITARKRMIKSDDVFKSEVVSEMSNSSLSSAVDRVNTYEFGSHLHSQTSDINKSNNHSEVDVTGLNLSKMPEPISKEPSKVKKSPKPTIKNKLQKNKK